MAYPQRKSSDSSPGHKLYSIGGRLILLCAIFAFFVLLIVLLIAKLPPSQHSLFFPHNLAELKEVSDILREYSAIDYNLILMLISVVTIFKYSFNIPGAAILNILAGVMYGYPAIILVTILSSIGATISHLISKYIIGGMIFGTVIAKSRILAWKSTMDQYKSGRIVYLISLRSMPLMPGWFLNLGSPFVGIQPHETFVSCLIGNIPFNYVCVDAAHTLSSLNDLSDVMNWHVMLRLSFISILALLPALFKKQLHTYIQSFAVPTNNYSYEIV